MQKLTGLFPNIQIQVHDQTFFFKNADKLTGPQQAPHRMLPPDQGFTADDLTRFDVVFCLNINDDFPTGHRTFNFIEHLLFANEALALLIRIEADLRKQRIGSILCCQSCPILHELHRQGPLRNRIYSKLQG